MSSEVEPYVDGNHVVSEEVSVVDQNLKQRPHPHSEGLEEA